MGQARELMDRATEAVFAQNFDALREIYAPDVVASTPDEGVLHGVDALIEYMRQMTEAFPDMSYEMTRMHEAGDCAIDQGDVIATNTGPLAMPNGTSLPATGKQLRLRTIDVATVENGRISRHDFYFDQMEMLVQLGVLKEIAATV